MISIALVFLLYSVSSCFYRLYISPLSRIPGPKLAAATGWYETYFELFHKLGDQYLFHIQQLHREYGDIPTKTLKSPSC